MIKVLLLAVALVMMVPKASGAEYFVSLQGKDSNDGRSMAAAFRTIQKGVDALSAGDTLTIGPGEYPESVSRENLGSDGVETTIRAAVRGTVILRGDEAVEDWQKVPGYRFIYVSDLAAKPYAVAEVDTLKLLSVSVYLDELEFVPGSYFYDEEAKKLYLSSSDLQPPSQHAYRVSVRPTDGLRLLSPKRVTIDGLVATGYNYDASMSDAEGFGCRWGIYLRDPGQCVVRHCVAYLNGGGIALQGAKGGGKNTVEDCKAYANYSKFCSEGGNICFFQCGPGDILRRNYVYMSDGKGQWFYISTTGDLLMEESLGWGNSAGDLWIKGMREGAKPAWANRNVSLSNAPAPNHQNSMVSTGGDPDHAATMEGIDHRTSFYLDQEKDLDRNAEFADPYHLDFRLQSTSRFRTGGPDGAHRGPFPYTANIYYVRPDGNDSSDGLSLKTAWKSLARLTTLKAGDTVYLEHGTYAGDVSLTNPEIEVRGRGEEPVVLTGQWTLTNATGSALRNLIFTNAVKLVGGKDVEVNNCAFVKEGSLSAAKVEGVRVLHGVFAQTLSLEGCKAAFLAGNVYREGLRISQAGDVAFSDYNSYGENGSAWEVGGKKMSLAQVQAGFADLKSIAVEPQIEFSGGEVTLANQGAFNGRGPWGGAIGLYFEGKPRDLRVEGPFIHSVSHTIANLEWWTSVPTNAELSWGETPEYTEKKALHFQCFAAFSLTGLQPGKKYYYQLRVLEPFPSYPLKNWISSDVEKVIRGEFTTASSPPVARQWYVSPEGNDANDGSSMEKAMRNINKVAAHVGPGDTVWFAGGDYHQTLWLRATGEKDRPVTFRGLPGQRATFHGIKRQIPAAVVGHGKDYQNFDALYGQEIGYLGGLSGKQLAHERGGMFVFTYSDHVNIERCLLDGRGEGYSPRFVVADACEDMLVKNCVSIDSMGGWYFYDCPNLRLENNVIFRQLITQLFIINHADQPSVLKNSIITDGLAVKFAAPMICIGRPGSFREENNCFYGRIRAEEKTVLLVYDDFSFERERVASGMTPARADLPAVSEAVRLKFAELAPRYGAGNSLFVDPLFAGLKGLPEKDAKGRVIYPPDRLPAGPAEFDQFFATNPEVVNRGIGLMPSAFTDFGFRSKE